jgi:hypothetical protein
LKARTFTAAKQSIHTPITDVIAKTQEIGIICEPLAIRLTMGTAVFSDMLRKLTIPN